jgi:hypothetical protein
MMMMMWLMVTRTNHDGNDDDIFGHDNNGAIVCGVNYHSGLADCGGDYCDSGDAGYNHVSVGDDDDDMSDASQPTKIVMTVITPAGRYANAAI